MDFIHSLKRVWYDGFACGVAYIDLYFRLRVIIIEPVSSSAHQISNTAIFEIIFS